MSPQPTSSRRSQRRRSRRDREGAVLLVVLLVVLIITSSLTVAVRSTQSEVRAAGEERVLRQTRASAEAAMTTTIAWIDMLGDAGQWVDTWNTATSGASPPRMVGFGAPSIDPANRHMAGRTWAVQQGALRGNGTAGKPKEYAPLSDANSDDPVGSFGPGQAYRLATMADAYVVDLTDCSMAPSGSSAGAPVGGGASGLMVVQFYCVLTAHFSMQATGATATKAWTIGGQQYDQPRLATFNDSRATILTPEMIVPR